MWCFYGEGATVSSFDRAPVERPAAAGHVPPAPSLRLTHRRSDDRLRPRTRRVRLLPSTVPAVALPWRSRRPISATCVPRKKRTRPVAPARLARTTVRPHALFEPACAPTPREAKEPAVAVVHGDQHRVDTVLAEFSARSVAGMRKRYAWPDSPRKCSPFRRLVHQRPPLRLGLARTRSVGDVAHLDPVVRRATAGTVLRAPRDEDRARASVAAGKPPARQAGAPTRRAASQGSAP